MYQGVALYKTFSVCFLLYFYMTKKFKNKNKNKATYKCISYDCLIFFLMEYTHELFTWKFCHSVCENKFCTYLNVYLMYMYFKWCIIWCGILYLYFSFVDVFVFSCSYIIFTNVLICPLAKSEIPKLFPLYPSNQVAWVFYTFVWIDGELAVLFIRKSYCSFTLPQQI